MGRFDALTTLEEKQETKAPAPIVKTATPASKPVPTSHSAQKKPIKIAESIKKPENLKSGKPEKTLSSSNNLDKPEKYSTLLNPNLVKKIKIHAAELDIKDYQVIELALNEYFKKN